MTKDDEMKKEIRRAAQGATIVSLVLALSGCIAAPLIVGGAAVTTATVVTDRRSTGTIVSDQVIEQRVGYEIDQALSKAKRHITVTSYEGRVLLTGEVATLNDRQVAQQVASVSLEVREVINELAVMDPSSMASRLSDSMLATKVRSAIIGNSKISLNQMKVTVDRGIVYLMGLVTREEAKLAAQTAAEVSGVQKIVTCFTVESPEEVRRRMQNVEQPGDHFDTNN